MTTKEELKTEIRNISQKLDDLEDNMEDLQAKIDSLHDTFDKVSDKIENIDEHSSQYGLWKPKEGEGYWFIASDGSIECATWCNDVYDNVRIATGNCFKTEEQAEKALERKKIRRQLKDIAERLNKGEKIDWYNLTQEKYHLYFNFDRDFSIMESVDFYSKYQDVIYCLDENFKAVAIQEIGEDRLKEYLKEC